VITQAIEGEKRACMRRGELTAPAETLFPEANRLFLEQASKAQGKNRSQGRAMPRAMGIGPDPGVDLPVDARLFFLTPEAACRRSPPWAQPCRP